MFVCISNFLCAFNCLCCAPLGMNLVAFAFLSLFFLSSTLKKTRVPGTAGNSETQTHRRRNECYKKEVRRSVVVVQRERERVYHTYRLPFVILGSFVKNTRKRKTSLKNAKNSKKKVYLKTERCPPPIIVRKKKKRKTRAICFLPEDPL